MSRADGPDPRIPLHEQVMTEFQILLIKTNPYR